MADALIENPILNSPFLEPRRHFKFTDAGITNEKDINHYGDEVLKVIGT